MKELMMTEEEIGNLDCLLRIFQIFPINYRREIIRSRSRSQERRNENTYVFIF